MQFQPRFQNVEAKGATITEDGSQVFILFSDGAPCAVAEAGAFNTLYAPVVADDPAPPVEGDKYGLRRPPKVKEKAPARRTFPPRKAAAATHMPGDPTGADLVLMAIRKGPPRSSGELIAHLGIANHLVYSSVNVFKKRGIIVGKPDDSDEGGGIMKWHPAFPAESK